MSTLRTFQTSGDSWYIIWDSFPLFATLTDMIATLPDVLGSSQYTWGSLPSQLYRDTSFLFETLIYTFETCSPTQNHLVKCLRPFQKYSRHLLNLTDKCSSQLLWDPSSLIERIHNAFQILPLSWHFLSCLRHNLSCLRLFLMIMSPSPSHVFETLCDMYDPSWCIWDPPFWTGMWSIWDCSSLRHVLACWRCFMICLQLPDLCETLPHMLETIPYTFAILSDSFENLLAVFETLPDCLRPFVTYLRFFLSFYNHSWQIWERSFPICDSSWRIWESS